MASKESLEFRKEKNKRRPVFLRQDYHHRTKVQDDVWRKPKGHHSKMRQHKRSHRAVVKIGYRNPAEARGLHKTGAEFVYVNTLADINKVHPAHQIGILNANVGAKKKYEILKSAVEKKISFANINAAKFISDFEAKLKAKIAAKAPAKVGEEKTAAKPKEEIKPETKPGAKVVAKPKEEAKTTTNVKERKLPSAEATAQPKSKPSSREEANAPEHSPKHVEGGK